jgi:hypothetical protein
MKESLQALAKRLQTSIKTAPAKDTAIQPHGAPLYEMRNGGLILCICPDSWKTGDSVRLTIPYIIVHSKKINVPKPYYAAEDDGTGEDTLVAFIDENWTDKLEDIQQIKPKRRVKSLNGTFPKILIDIICTLEAIYGMGLTTDGLPEDIADYEMAVWLRKLVGDTVKDVDKYYAFLDTTKQRIEASEFNGMGYDTAVVKLEINYNKVYDFLIAYKLLLPIKEV